MRSVVSIPFKRESLSKVNEGNGDESNLNKEVSIPFKRERLSKVTREKFEKYEDALGFNSLQTGKPIQSDWRARIMTHAKRVSIPFKRESLSKEPLKFA